MWLWLASRSTYILGLGRGLGRGLLVVVPRRVSMNPRVIAVASIDKTMKLPTTSMIVTTWLRIAIGHTLLQFIAETALVDYYSVLLQSMTWVFGVPCLVTAIVTSVIRTISAEAHSRHL